VYAFLVPSRARDAWVVEAAREENITAKITGKTMNT